MAVTREPVIRYIPGTITIHEFTDDLRTLWRMLCIASAIPLSSLFIATAAGADQYASLHAAVPMQKGWVTDNAGILSQVQQERLTGLLSNYYAETHHQMALLIVTSLGGESLETYSLRVANAWQLGCRGLDDGILVTLATQERRVRIELGRGMERFISDAQAQSIINETMIPAFAKGDLFAGFEGGFKRLMVEARQLVNPASCHASKVAVNNLSSQVG
jgi:uncharacterized protein